MKKLLVAMLLLTLGQQAVAQSHNLNRTNTAGKEIEWMTWDEVQVAMKREPRKVWVDVYTDWCGWCKKMDKSTFSNAKVIDYVKDKFYFVKFNAEQREDIRFMGKMYAFDPSMKVNQLALELLHGQLSYPTGIFMEENFQSPQVVPGYLDVPQFEMILKYLGGGNYKTTKFEDWQKSFQATWG